MRVIGQVFSRFRERARVGSPTVTLPHVNDPIALEDNNPVPQDTVGHTVKGNDKTSVDPDSHEKTIPHGFLRL